MRKCKVGKIACYAQAEARALNGDFAHAAWALRAPPQNTHTPIRRNAHPTARVSR